MAIHIHVHKHHESEHIILTQLNKIMAKLEEFNAVLAKIDEATNDIALDIERLIAKLEGGGLSEAEEADVLAKLQAAADRLKTVADVSTE